MSKIIIVIGEYQGGTSWSAIEASETLDIEGYQKAWTIDVEVYEKLKRAERLWDEAQTIMTEIEQSKSSHTFFNPEAGEVV